ncbi:MAG: bile acid:sodium symporter [Deltaproteobacteria bacterium]|nr:bile acid:sodium symporter [Deltaproteobacteria bacterium]
MFRTNDLILILVVFSSMFTGIYFPDATSLFQPYPVYAMMFLLFLSFISIDMRSVWDLIQKSWGTVLWLSVLKMLILPVGIYFLFKVFYPPYALAALLVTGISTGVVAPFISTLVGANGPLVLILVVVSSLVVPFTLPALIKILLEREIQISLLAMMRVLFMVVFIPAFLVEVSRRLIPGTLKRLQRAGFYMSLGCFTVVNLGVFSKYGLFFRQNPATILEAAIVAMILAIIYFILGIVVVYKAPLKDQLASIIGFANMNNVLVIVFAAEFFSPLEPTLAAVYILPFFGIIFPLRIYRGIRDKKDQGELNLNPHR